MFEGLLWLFSYVNNGVYKFKCFRSIKLLVLFCDFFLVIKEENKIFN